MYMNIEPTTEVVEHSGAVVVSWMRIENGCEFLQSKTYYGYSEEEALKAWKNEYWSDYED